jgi:hypothetical protein
VWMPTSVEWEEVAWVVVLWPLEGFLKLDLSTPIYRTGLEGEDPSMVVLEDTMDKKYTAWKGYSNMN